MSHEDSKYQTKFNKYQIIHKIFSNYSNIVSSIVQNILLNIVYAWSLATYIYSWLIVGYWSCEWPPKGRSGPQKRRKFTFVDDTRR